jgi:hypothetical protein
MSLLLKAPISKRTKIENNTKPHRWYMSSDLWLAMALERYFEVSQYQSRVSVFKDDNGYWS